MSGFISRFERRLRVWTQRGFGQIYRRRRTEPRDLGSIDRVLLVRTDKIGDAIVSTPVIAALKRQFPHAEIDILLGSRNGAAGPLLPGVDHVLRTDRKLSRIVATLRRLRARRYDVAIDMLTADSVSAALYTAGSKARITIGFEDGTSPLYDFSIPPPSSGLHHVPRLLRLLAPLNIAVTDDMPMPSIVLSSESVESARALLDSGADDRPVLMINISGSSPAKFWGAENFSRLARDLNSASLRAVLVAAPNDRALLEEISSRSGAEALPPRQDLMQFAAVLSLADGVISPDASTVHIAAALGKPVVTLTSSALVAREWAPWGVPNRAVSCATSIPDIPYDAVVAAARSLVAEVLSSSMAAAGLSSPS